MFDLEKAIAAWRQFQRNNRTFVGDDLDELESHVRHQVAGLQAEGLSEKAAYRQTMGEMGDYGTAEAEYRKVYWGKLRHRRELYHELGWRLSMLRNYVKIALRNLAKHKVYSVVNIGGLALGMAVCVLILLFVREENSYDQYQLYKDRIFRIQRGRLASDGSIQDNFSTLAPAFVPLLEENFPALEHVARMFKPDDFSLTYGEHTFVEQGSYFAEADIFEVLTLPLLSGDQRTALQEPGSIVLSASKAKKYFADEDPLGQELIMDSAYPLRVTGVMEDLPRKTHIHFDGLVSYTTLSLFGQEAREAFLGPDNFEENVTLVYARLSIFSPALDGRIIGVVKDFHYESLHSPIVPILTYLRPDQANTIAVRLDRGALTEGVDHIKTVLDDFLPGSLIEVTFLDERIDALYRREARMMKITGFFGLLAVLIACLGLFGLATFMAERRTREVGVRKVFGASALAIMRLLSTTFVKWVLVANIVAWPLAYLVMNRWLQDFAYQAGMGIEIFILTTLISLVIAWLSVSYQAIRAARVNLVQSLKYE